MVRRFYRGIPVPGKLPTEYSYPRYGKQWTQSDFHNTLTIPQKLEIIRKDAETLAQRMTAMKTPISYSHQTRKNGGKIVVGRVEEATVDDDNGMSITFSVDSDADGGDFLSNRIKSGFLKELSLCHDHTNLIPLEVSICKEGCRPGTSITELKDGEYNPRTTGNQASQPVIVSASFEDMMLAGQAPNGQAFVQGSTPAQPAAASAPAAAQQPAAAAPPQEQPAEENGQSPALVSAMAKLGGGNNIFSKAEKLALATAVNSNLKMAEESANLNSQKTQIFVKEILTLLKDLTGDEKLMEMEAGATDALRRGDGASLEHNIGPAIVAASKAAMQRMNAPAAATHNQQDPDLAAALQDFTAHWHAKQQQPQSFVMSGLSQGYTNAALRSLPPVVVSASKESMYAQQQFTQPKSGVWSALPQSVYSNELEHYGKSNFGGGFKFSQVLTPQTLAAVGAPVSSAAMSSSYLSSAQPNYASQPFNTR